MKTLIRLLGTQKSSYLTLLITFIVLMNLAVTPVQTLVFAAGNVCETSSTRGTVYFDAFASRRQSYIGP